MVHHSSNGQADCARPRSARYCSRECQRRDWQTHRVLCHAMADTRRRMAHHPASYGFTHAADVVNRWMKIWNNPVILNGLVGLDLAEHPEHLDTHA